MYGFQNILNSVVENVNTLNENYERELIPMVMWYLNNWRDNLICDGVVMYCEINNVKSKNGVIEVTLEVKEKYYLESIKKVYKAKLKTPDEIAMRLLKTTHNTIVDKLNKENPTLCLQI